MAITKVELASSFLQDILESEETQASIQQYKDLLTGQTQVVTQQYQTTTQTAAEQASYDISGAYANYLKQQRSIAAQGQLESGYKEEVGDVLQSQYQSAYSQAKATQAETTAAAQAQYVKNLTTYEEAAKKAYTQIYDAAEKEAQLKANLYKFAEEQLALSDTRGIYTAPDEQGRVSLTAYGTEQFRKYLLQDDKFKQALEEENMTDELEYYLAAPQKLHETLFGFTETQYDKTSEVSTAARASNITEDYSKEILTNAYETIGYTDVFGENTDYNAYFNVYKTELGLTDQDIKDVLLSVTTLSNDQKKAMSLEEALYTSWNIHQEGGATGNKAMPYFFHEMFIKKAQDKYSNKE